MTEHSFACFDLDGTLIVGDSFYLFLRYMLKQGYYPKSTILRIMKVALLRKSRQITLLEAKTKLLAPLKGKTKAEITNLSCGFWQECLSVRLRKSMLERLYWHQAQKHHTVLLTAAPDIYLSTIRDALRIDQFYGTPLLYQYDQFSGRLGDHLFATAKVERLKELIEPFGKSTVIYGYSDHHSDLPLLTFCTYPHAIAPTTKLLHQARQKGWPAWNA